jgi:hypothetical protein
MLEGLWCVTGRSLILSGYLIGSLRLYVRLVGHVTLWGPLRVQIPDGDCYASEEFIVAEVESKVVVEIDEGIDVEI